MGTVAFNVLGRRAYCNGPLTSLDADLVWALEWWSSYLTDLQPRTVPLANMRKPVIILPGGACEPDEDSPLGVNASYGAVM